MLDIDIINVLACERLDQEEIEAILTYIDQIKSELYANYQINDLYQFSADFNLENEQQRLEKLLNSDLFIQANRFWENIFTSMPASNFSEDNMPDNFMYLKVDRDEQQRPTRLLLGFESKNVSERIDFNLPDIQMKIQAIKTHQLTCLQNVREVEDRIKSFLLSLQRADSNEQSAKLVAAFNLIYPGQLYLHYHIDENSMTASYDVRDQSNTSFISGTHKLMNQFSALESPHQQASILSALERPHEQASLSSSLSNFWNEANLTKKAAIVATAAGAVGLGVIAAAHMMRRR